MVNAAEAFPPSEYLREELDARGWSEVDFAHILDRPAQVVSEILNDRKEITPETALEIGHALGTSPELWLNLQNAYRLHVAGRNTDLTPVARRAQLRALLPIRELRIRGWLPDTEDLDDMEAAVCNFLGMPALHDEPKFLVAARRSNNDSPFSPEQIAWIARVRDIAGHLEPPTYDVERLSELAAQLASRLSDPFEAEHLTGWLNECGVSLVVELPLRSSKLDGAVFFVSASPVIGLTTRGNRFDGFVFTLLHEIAHLVLGHASDGKVQLDEDFVGGSTEGEVESEANALASSWIFPGGLEVREPITTSKILDAADLFSVHPSLVIGRLQWDGLLEWSQYRNRIPRVRPLLPGSEGAHRK